MDQPLALTKSSLTSGTGGGGGGGGGGGERSVFGGPTERQQVRHAPKLYRNLDLKLSVCLVAGLMGLTWPS